MMQGLWLEDQKLAFREDLPIPVPKDGEALVRVRLAGICGTDLEMVRGYYPFRGVPGHEFVGEVVAIKGHAPHALAWVKRRVVSEINVVCRECQLCRSGLSAHCENRTVIGIRGRDGVFAEYLTLPLVNLYEIPDSVGDESAVFTEPLAAALEIQQQVSIRPADRVLLIGAGRLGLLIAQVLALTGCNLEVLARRPVQRQLLESWKIPVIDVSGLPDRKADIVVEASGSSEGFALARRAVRPRGTIVLKSTYKGDLRLNLSAVVVDEVTLVGSRCGPFQPALKLLESGWVNTVSMINARYSLSEGRQAFEHSSTAGALKVLFQVAPQGVVPYFLAENTR